MDPLQFYQEKFTNFVNFLKIINNEYPFFVERFYKWKPHMKEMFENLIQVPVEASSGPFAMTMVTIKRGNPAKVKEFHDVALLWFNEGASENVVNQIKIIFEIPKEEMLEPYEVKTLVTLFRYLDLFLDILQ